MKVKHEIDPEGLLYTTLFTLALALYYCATNI